MDDSKGNGGGLVAAVLSKQETRNLFAFIVVLATVMVAEGAYGLAVNSLGLISDAFHMAFHCCALAISLFGMIYARRQPSFAFSYGYERYEVLAAFSNAIMLIFVCLFVIVGALHRLIEPQPFKHNPGVSLRFGLVGLAVNVVGAFVLGPGQGSIEQLMRYSGGTSGSNGRSWSAPGSGQSHNMNVRAVYLHLYADAVSSVAVIIASIAHGTFGIASADTMQSLFVACFTLWIAFPLFTATGMVLLQAAPQHMRTGLERCRREALTVEGVLEVLDERWWTQSPGFVVGSLTVRVRGETDEGDIITKVHRIYSKGANVADLTVQVEKDTPLSWLTGAGGDGAVPQGIAIGDGAGHDDHHGHSHAHGHSHGAHGHDDHGHSHGQPQSHGHSHGSGSSCSHDHGHSHGSSGFSAGSEGAWRQR